MTEDEPLIVEALAALLQRLPPEVQGYEVWIEADPSSPVYASDVKVWHDKRQVRL